MFYFDKVLSKTVLKSDLISVPHFFTTKELLLKSGEEDKKLLIENNLNNLKNQFQLDLILSPKQTHSDNVEIALSDKIVYNNTDALILSDRKIGIFLNFADCTPIIFYDTIKNIAAIAHCGWRGTVKKIAQKTVFKMNKDFGCKTSDINAIIGPCISFESFETSNEICDLLFETVHNNKYFIKKDEKNFADLKGINYQQLIDIGVENIDIAPYCTVLDNDKFYSYRKENQTTNRISAFICLN